MWKFRKRRKAAAEVTLYYLVESKVKPIDFDCYSSPSGKVFQLLNLSLMHFSPSLLFNTF